MNEHVEKEKSESKKKTLVKKSKGNYLCGSTDSKEIERVYNAMLGTSSGEFD